VWNYLAKVQDFAPTIYPIFTYFTCYQVEIHGPARSSDILRITFACKREYFLHLLPWIMKEENDGGGMNKEGDATDARHGGIKLGG